MRNSIKRVLLGLIGAAVFAIHSPTALSEPFTPTIVETVFYINHHSTPPGDAEWLDPGFSIQNGRYLCMSFRRLVGSHKFLYAKCMDASHLSIDHIRFKDGSVSVSGIDKIDISCVYQHNSLRDLCVKGYVNDRPLDESDQNKMTLDGGSDVYRALVHLARMLNVPETGDFPPHF